MPMLIPIIAAGAEIYAGAAAIGAVGASTASMVVGGIMVAGGALTAIGAVTGNKSMMQWGGVLGLAGGVGGLASGAWQQAAGGLATEAGTGAGSFTAADMATKPLAASAADTAGAAANTGAGSFTANEMATAATPQLVGTEALAAPATQAATAAPAANLASPAADLAAPAADLAAPAANAAGPATNLGGSGILSPSATGSTAFTQPMQGSGSFIDPATFNPASTAPMSTTLNPAASAPNFNTFNGANGFGPAAPAQDAATTAGNSFWSQAKDTFGKAADWVEAHPKGSKVLGDAVQGGMTALGRQRELTMQAELIQQAIDRRRRAHSDSLTGGAGGMGLLMPKYQPPARP